MKPIRLITQFTPGASGDISLRIIAPLVSQSVGQPVVIDNRPGAGGVVAVEQVMRAPPDGYTIVASSNGLYITRQFLVKNMTFDPLKDLTPITQFLKSYFVMVASPSFAPSSFKEMLDYARSNPGKVNFATSGIGTEGHLTAEEIMEMTGVKLVHVPYKTAAQPLMETVAGQMQITFSTYSAALPHLKSGKLRVLAVVKETRLAALPDVPAMPEIIPGFDPPSSGVGIFGPAGMPATIARRLQSEFAKAAADPEAQARLKEGGFEALMSTPEAFAASMRREISLTRRLVEAAGIKPE